MAFQRATKGYCVAVSLFCLFLQGAARTLGFMLPASVADIFGSWRAHCFCRPLKCSLDSCSLQLSVSAHMATVMVCSMRLALTAEDVSGSNNYR